MTKNLDLQAASNKDFSLESSTDVLHAASIKGLEKIGLASHKEKQCEESMRECVRSVGKWCVL